MNILARFSRIAALVWAIIAPLETFRSIAPFSLCCFGGLFFAFSFEAQTSAGSFICTLIGGVSYAFALDLVGQRERAKAYEKGAVEVIKAFGEGNVLNIIVHNADDGGKANG